MNISRILLLSALITIPTSSAWSQSKDVTPAANPAAAAPATAPVAAPTPRSCSATACSTGSTCCGKVYEQNNQDK